VRDLTDSDDLSSLSTNGYDIPKMDNKCVVRLGVERDGKIVAAGFVRVTSEGILAVDPNEPKVSRVKHIIALVHKGIQCARVAGLDECHVFVQDMNVFKILGRLGFVNCPEEYRMVVRF